MRCVSDLQKIMAESRDYDELLFAWKGWRDSAGKVLRQDYKRYVELANMAAKLNGMTKKSPRRDFQSEGCSKQLPLSNRCIVYFITNKN